MPHDLGKMLPISCKNGRTPKHYKPLGNSFIQLAICKLDLNNFLVQRLAKVTMYRLHLNSAECRDSCYIVT